MSDFKPVQPEPKPKPLSGVDRRLPLSGVDRRLPLSGVDRRLPLSGVDRRLPLSGVDRRLPTKKPKYFCEKTGLEFSGAGTIVIDDLCDPTTGTSEPCIVLAKNKYGEFADFGGFYDVKDATLATTAHKELREESRNLFHIDPRHFTKYENVRVSDKTHAYYRVYVLKINGIKREEFQFNKQLIDSAHHQSGEKVDDAWIETIDIAYIPLKSINFATLGINNDVIILKDIDGNDILLCGRTRMMISRSFKQINEVINANPIASRDDMITYRSSESWTNGTLCFMVK